MSAVYYNVAPRYTAGSPAMVSRKIAEEVAHEEQAAYMYALDGTHGPEMKHKAEHLGLSRIVYSQHESRGRTVFTDLITGETWSPEEPKVADRVEVARRLSALQAMRQIQAALDGQEWDGDTLTSVADIMRRAGYSVRPPR